MGQPCSGREESQTSGGEFRPIGEDYGRCCSRSPSLEPLLPSRQGSGASSLALLTCTVLGRGRLIRCGHYSPLINSLDGGEKLANTYGVCVCVCVCVSCSVVFTLCDTMNCSLPVSSIHAILQARILEWVAFPFSRGLFLTQGLNPGLLHYRQILYHLSHQGNSQTHIGSWKNSCCW